MRVVLIEDEPSAASRLKKLVMEFLPEAQIAETFDSVKGSIQWFITNPQPDLVFMDIQLADGLSFEIFEFVPLKSPVIFTTAYDEYALKAFKVNSIDYLLKPIDPQDLERAIRKFQQLQNPSGLATEQVHKLLQALTPTYKNRFLVKIGEHIKSIPTDDIRYIFSQEKTSFAVLSDGKRYILDPTLDQLEAMLDPKNFFRLNRQYIARMEAIADIISYSNSRLKIFLHACEDKDILMSREKVADFKRWLDQ